MTTLPLAGKIALVTGATRGLGQAIALQLQAQGAQVIGTATTTAGAETITAYLNSPHSRGVQLDVTDDQACGFSPKPSSDSSYDESSLGSYNKH